MALSMLGTATNAGQIINKNDTFISSSSDMHAVLNRTVILNSASWHFLDLIFHKYSDNLTEKISIERFKDLLKDLNLGETVSATETSHEQHQGTSHRHGGKNSRSQDGESSEVSRQRNMRRRRSERQSNGERRQLQLNSKTNQIRPRSQRRERRSARDRLHTSEGHAEVRYYVLIKRVISIYFCLELDS